MSPADRMSEDEMALRVALAIRIMVRVRAELQYKPYSQLSSCNLQSAIDALLVPTPFIEPMKGHELFPTQGMMQAIKTVWHTQSWTGAQLLMGEHLTGIV